VSLHDTAVRVRPLLESVGEDPAPVGVVARRAAWCAQQQAQLARIVAEVVCWEATGSSSGLRLDSGAFEPSVGAGADDDAARAAAGAALASLLFGDGTTFARLAVLWSSNPAFAVPLASALRPEAVVDQLGWWRDLLALPADDEQRRDRLAVAHGLVRVLATASQVGSLPWTLADLVAADPAAFDDPTAHNELALLFLPGTRWADEVLVDAVELLVLPLNRLPGVGVAATVGTPGADCRLLVLTALAGSPQAATQVLRTVDLDDLARSDLAYGDGGRALGRVLIAGTRPGGAADADEAMTRLVRWVAATRDLPPLAHAVLADVAQPYLASFGSDVAGLDGPVVDALPELDEASATGYLLYTALHPEARHRLAEVTRGWVLGHLDRLSLQPRSPEGADVVASVARHVDVAIVLGEADGAHNEDEARAGDRSRLVTGLGLATLLVTANVTAPAWMHGVRADGVASSGTLFWGPVVDALLPPTEHGYELLVDHVGRGDARLHLELRYAALQALWANRARNAVFEGWGGRLEVPTMLLRDPARPDTSELRALAELDDDARDAFADWYVRQDMATDAPLLAELGDVYGLTPGVVSPAEPDR
jgi:hypothetical protein